MEDFVLECEDFCCFEYVMIQSDGKYEKKRFFECEERVLKDVCICQ